MAKEAQGRATAEQGDRSGAEAREWPGAEPVQKPKLLLVSANEATSRGYEAIAREYPDTELLIAGSMILTDINRTAAIYLLVTKNMSEQNATMLLKKQWERNAFNVDLRRCYWIPINDIEEAVNSHADEVSSMLFALAVRKFGMTKLIRRLVKGLPDAFKQGDETAARQMRGLIFKKTSRVN